VAGIATATGSPVFILRESRERPHLRSRYHRFDLYRDRTRGIAVAQLQRAPSNRRRNENSETVTIQPCDESAPPPPPPPRVSSEHPEPGGGGQGGEDYRKIRSGRARSATQQRSSQGEIPACTGIPTGRGGGERGRERDATFILTNHYFHSSCSRHRREHAGLSDPALSLKRHRERARRRARGESDGERKRQRFGGPVRAAPFFGPTSVINLGEPLTPPAVFYFFISAYRPPTASARAIARADLGALRPD